MPTEKGGSGEVASRHETNFPPMGGAGQEIAVKSWHGWRSKLAARKKSRQTEGRAADSLQHHLPRPTTCRVRREALTEDTETRDLALKKIRVYL